MTAVPKKKYTLEEYLELDRNSEERYEYFNQRGYKFERVI